MGRGIKIFRRITKLLYAPCYCASRPLTRELNNLRHRDDFRTDVFVKLLGAKCIRDTYPGVLVENQKAVRGTRPLGFVMCDSEPFLLVEYAVGGVRLSDVMIESVDQVHSIVAQVILAVAIAEEAMQFEHRDLQMDNVLVKMTSNETAVFIYNKKRIVLHTRGVVACVIDFNLSRATIGGQSVEEFTENYERVQATLPELVQVRSSLI